MKRNETSVVAFYTTVLLSVVSGMTQENNRLLTKVNHSKEYNDCPIVAKNCLCEHLFGGGYNIYCPNRENENILIHYRTPYQMFLRCNPNSLDIRRRGDKQYSTDIIYQLENITVGQIEWLQLQSCPMPTASVSLYMKAMKATGLKNLQIKYGRFVESDARLVENQFLGLNNLSTLIIQNSEFFTIESGAFNGLENLQDLKLHYNKLKSINPDSLLPLVQLKRLDFLEKGLIILPRQLLRTQQHLETLRISLYKIKFIDKNIFKNNTNLISISLRDIRMDTQVTDDGAQSSYISEGIFDPLVNLKNISFEGKGLDHLSENLFVKNKKLEKFSWKMYLCSKYSLSGRQNGACDVIFPNIFKHTPFLKYIIVDRAIKATLNLNETLFWGLRRLEDVTMRHTGIRAMPELLFRDTVNIKRIDLSSNLIDKLPKTVFGHLKYVELIDVHGNKIKEMSDKLFEMNANLKTLKMSYNDLRTIHNRALISTSKLENLDLSNNHIYFNETSQPNWSSLTRLQYVNLAHNNITLKELPYEWKHGWLRLRTLNISHNNIGPKINVFQLKFEQKKITVDLSNNAIEKLEFNPSLSNKLKAYQSTSSLSDKPIVNITNNPITCDCESLHLAELVQRTLNSSVQHWFKFSKHPITCSKPKRLQKTNILYVPYDQFSCEFPSSTVNESCPNECKCSYTPYSSQIYLGCDGKGLTNVPYISSLSKKYAIVNNVTLNLHNNGITNLHNASRDTDLYDSVTSLLLSHNNFTTLSREDLPKGLNNMLYLNNNQFKHINETVLDLMKHLRSVKFGNNNFQCDCDSYLLYQFVMQNKGLIRDINNITFNCNGIATKAMSVKDKELFCTNYHRILSTYLLPIVLTILAFGVIFVLILLKKNTILMKLYSNPLTRGCFLPEKDDHNTPYDVFVSYAHQDEQYVEEVLVPGLEESSDIKYKCLVHVRDFIPGRNISDQIIDAVENSKRTLICLSKHFVASDWAQHEFDVAHRRKRVIIVVVGEIPSKHEMSREFWEYITSNTYLSHNDKWFWEKLRFALPHHNNTKESHSRRLSRPKTIREGVQFTNSSVGNLTCNETNDIYLNSDESIVINESQPTFIVPDENQTNNGMMAMKCLPGSSSPATSTSTMTPSPKPKKESKNK